MALSSPSEELVLTDMIGLMEDPVNGSPVVILHDRAGKRILPIWVGDPEARAIDMAINKALPPRPLTHTLLLRVIAGFGGKLSKIVVDRASNNTYFSSIFITVNNSTLKVDSRPSDAIALAIEAQAPIFVDKTVMEKAGQPEKLPYLSSQQEKRQFSKEDLRRMSKMIEEARAREQQA